MNEAWAIMITGAFLSAIVVGGFTSIGVFLWWMHGKIVWLVEQMIENRTKVKDLRVDVNSLLGSRLHKIEKVIEDEEEPSTTA